MLSDEGENNAFLNLGYVQWRFVSFLQSSIQKNEKQQKPSTISA